MFNVDDAVIEAYEAIRADSSENTWAIFTYKSKSEIELSFTGNDHDEFLSHLDDDMRAYCYVRVDTGNGAKFVFVTWIGPSVPPLKKAKVSTDKAFVKEVVQIFDKEILADEKTDLQLDTIKMKLERNQ